MIFIFHSTVKCISKMTSSLTAAFSGNSSKLQANFFPEITLDEYSDYSCALLDLVVHSNVDLQKLAELSTVRIDCDIVSGSYINGVHCHTIHQFVANAPRVKTQTFVESPKHLNYFPVKTKSLRSIQISIVDHKGALVDFKGDITCRINIKRDNNK